MPAVNRTTTAKTGLEKTFGLLALTNNDAAVAVLLAALDSPAAEIQDRSLSAIFQRKNTSAQREVLARLHTAPDHWRTVLENQKGRITGALRDGLLGADLQLRKNACQAILWLQEYDLAPALLTALEDSANPQAQLAAKTLTALADTLHDHLFTAPRDQKGRRDPQRIRQRFAGSLEGAVRHYSRHNRAEVIEAFLLLAERDNVTLKQVLQDPHHAAFATLLNELLHSERQGVIQLLTTYLDDPHAPTAALSLIAHRRDALFLQTLARKCSHALTPVHLQNLKRVESLACLKLENVALLDTLDESQQIGVVHLAMHTRLTVADASKIIEHLILRGRTGGRIAAVRALLQIPLPQVDELILHALGDAEPTVQAAVLPQIRQRGTPGALARLISLVDSPHACVRQAARESLLEFSFDRYLSAFDGMDDAVRRSTGNLVWKIDPTSLPNLMAELKSPTRSRRLRGLTVAQAMGAANCLETAILDLLSDEDHLVRAEAARALGDCYSGAAHTALQKALADRSLAVQEAAERSLGLLMQGAHA